MAYINFPWVTTDCVSVFNGFISVVMPEAHPKPKTLMLTATLHPNPVIMLDKRHVLHVLSGCGLQHHYPSLVSQLLAPRYQLPTCFPVLWLLSASQPHSHVASADCSRRACRPTSLLR